MNRRYKIAYVITSCKKTGPIQVLLNIISNLERSVFEPMIVTLYPETKSSRLQEFADMGVEQYYCHTDKVSILLGRTSSLTHLLRDLNPDIIHSTGVFPDFAVSRIRPDIQLITLHNYMHDDYCSMYGLLLGCRIEWLQMKAVKKAAKVVTCSRSLSEIYKEKKKLGFGYVCNGVDTRKYDKVTDAEKCVLREKLHLPKSKLIFIYTASFIQRKDQQFLLKVFRDCDRLHESLLLLLGNGPDYEKLYDEYGGVEWVDMRGDVANVSEYLQASDVYISSSRSEGMPNGVLEAMATGLPIVLSDIRQHCELFEANKNIGMLYRLGDQKSAEEAICRILEEDLHICSLAAYETSHGKFNAEIMSKQYQEIYAHMAEH